MSDQRRRPTTSRSGRPLGFPRGEALSAAVELFWRRGFSGVSASDLADAMAIQRSSFYNTFGSREAVFQEALAVYGAMSPDAPLDRVKPGEPVLPVVISALRNVCHARATDPQARGCLVCNGISQLVGVDNKVGPLLEEAVRLRVASLQRLFQQAVEQGEMAPLPDVAATANSFVAFLIGLNLLSKVERDESALWAMCRQFLLGIGVPGTAFDPRP